MEPVTSSPLDLAVVGLHLALMVGFGVYFWFRVEKSSEYFDGGRRWGMLLVGFSVASANMGAANTVGSVTLAYREGVSAAWYVALQALAFIPFALLAVPKFYPLRETTLAEYLDNRYHPSLRPVTAAAMGLATLAILPAQIVGGASVIVSLTGIEYQTAFLTVGIALILYTALGGLPSLTWNDTYQWSMVLIGFLVGVPLIVAANGGLTTIFERVPITHGDIWRGATGGWSIFTIAAWSVTVLIARFGSQEWYQRIRSAASPAAARNGMIFGALMAAPFGVLTMLIGISALLQFPDLANPNEAFSRTMMGAIPAGFRALMMSAILAAVVSSGEASVNAATALLVNDIFKPFLFKGRSDHFYLRLSQIGTAMLGLLALILALTAPAIIEYIRLGFLIRTPVAITVLFGLYWRGATASGAIAGIVAGTSAVLLWQTFGDVRTIDAFWIGTPVTLAALFIGSRAFPGGRRTAAALVGVATLALPALAMAQAAAPAAGLVSAQVSATPSLETLLGSRAARQLVWSPDGKTLALSMSGGGPARIAVVDGTTGSVTPIAEGASPSWSSDGRQIVFLREGDIWIIDAAGRNERRVTSDKEDERVPKLSPDGRTVAFMSSRAGFQDVWTVPAGGGTPTKLTDQAMFRDMTRFGLSWSPDGRWIAYISNRGGFEYDELWIVPAAGGAARQISRGLNVTSQLDWSPDGTRIAFNGLAHDIYRYGDMSDVYVADVAAGTTRKVAMQVNATDNMGNAPTVWSADGRTIYFMLYERGAANLWAVPAAGGLATRMTDLDGELGSVAYSRAADRFAFVLSTSTDAGQIATLPASGGEPRPLARVGVKVDGLTPAEPIAFRSFDGLYIQGFLFKPRGFSPNSKYPALVQVHGGGHNTFLNGFNGIEQWLSQQGYVVLAINYRGSSGYGRAFQDLAIEDWGGKQALDAAAAGAFLRAQPFSNGKVGIYGGSYGGITTLAAITQAPDAFDAAVSMRGIYDFAAAYEEADRIGKIFTARGHRGTPAENPDAYKRSSSLSRVERLRIPLLVMHGGQDVRAPARQHQLLVDALRRYEKPFEQQVYPDEGHGFSRASQIDMYQRLLVFFDRELK